MPCSARAAILTPTARAACGSSRAPRSRSPRASPGRRRRPRSRSAPRPARSPQRGLLRHADHRGVPRVTSSVSVFNTRRRSRTGRAWRCRPGRRPRRIERVATSAANAAATRPATSVERQPCELHVEDPVEPPRHVRERDLLDRPTGSSAAPTSRRRSCLNARWPKLTIADVAAEGVEPDHQHRGDQQVHRLRLDVTRRRGDRPASGAQQHAQDERGPRRCGGRRARCASIRPPSSSGARRGPAAAGRGSR